jgi:glucose-1-phosphate cytidylyltransferase
MKAVILAGGLGTRISEETQNRPKPMVQIGGKPILWHILKLYSAHGVNEFLICCGYMGYLIKEYFANYFLHMSDVTFDMSNNSMDVHHKNAEPWKVTLVDTGEKTLTGGRLKRVQEYVENEEAFCFTYGDGLSDVDIKESIRFHKTHGRMATVTAVRPPGRYGAIDCDEKNLVTATWITQCHSSASSCATKFPTSHPNETLTRNGIANFYRVPTLPESKKSNKKLLDSGEKSD